MGGEVPERRGTAHPNIVPYQVMPTADGHFMLAVGNDQQFVRLCEVIGQPALSREPQFAGNAQRVENRCRLIELLSAVLVTKNTAHWLRALEAATVPCAPVNRIDQAFADPQVVARGMQIELAHPLAGRVPLVANPLKLSATPVEYTCAPPLLGADTRNVLSAFIGLDSDEIERLHRAGVIATR